MQKSSVGGWAPWGHMYFCVGRRLTEFTVQALTKLAVSEPVFMVSFIIHSSFNRSNLEKKFLEIMARNLYESHHYRVWCFLWVAKGFSEVGSQYIQTALNSQTCLSFPSAGILSMYQHTHFIWCFFYSNDWKILELRSSLAQDLVTCLTFLMTVV